MHNFKRLALASFLLSFSSMTFAKVFYLQKTQALSDQAVPISLTYGKKKIEVRFNLQKIEGIETQSEEGQTLFRLNHQYLGPNYQYNSPQVLGKSYLLKGHPSDFTVKVQMGDEARLIGVIPPLVPKYPCRCEEKQAIRWQRPGKKDRVTSYRLEFLGDFRGIPLTKLTLFPMHTENGRNLLVYPRAVYQVLGRKTVSLFNWQQSWSSTRAGKDMLLIGRQDLLKAMAPWKKRRQAEGLTIREISFKSDTMELAQLQAEVHKAYQTKAFHYAYLIGDENHLIPFYRKTTYDEQTPTDLPLFLMGGANDAVPDVLSGRLPANTPGEVAIVLNKILSYDNSMKKGAPWRRLNAVGIASDEGYNPTDVEYMEKMMSPLQDSFSTRVKYFFQKNVNSDPELINREINDGTYWLNYIGHGSGDSWSSVNQRPYYSEDVKNLNQKGTYPIIIDVACQNGRFNREGRLGETFILNQFQGAVAYLGGSVDISWHPPAVMAVGINQGMAARKYETLGEVIFAGQMHLMKEFNSRAEALENFIWYHLLGDPSLVIP